MPWWGWLIGYSVTAVCLTVLITGVTVIRSLVKLGREDEARHEALLRELNDLPPQPSR